MKKFVLIVAGGIGSRFQNDENQLPKQFLNLNNKPVIVHSIQAFFNAFENIECVIACNKNFMSHCKKIVLTYFPNKKIKIVAGGNSRTASVWNGLQHLENEAIVGIHDAVRPLITQKDIIKLYNAAIADKCAIPCEKVTDTIYLKKENEVSVLNRAQLSAVSTPQCFYVATLKIAYEKALRTDEITYTDDASVWSNAANNLKLIEIESKNIKITKKEDLIIAESLLNYNEPKEK